MKNIKNILFFSFIGVLALLAFMTTIDKVNAGFWDSFLKGFGGEEKNVSPAPPPPAPAPLYSPTVDYEEAVIKAVETGLKSVVSIVITKNVPILERCPYNPFGSEFDDFFGGGFGGFYTQCPSGRERKQEVGGGSGFIVSNDGYVVTNKHVVTDEKADYTVITSDGKKFNAKVLARDPGQDIAVLKIEGSGFTPAKLGDSDSVKLGQTAIAIGNALAEFQNTVSVGVISGLSRNIIASSGLRSTESIEGVFQTDAAINPGNSGGPLLNLKGEVIGINVAVAQGAQNIGFTIPINQAKRAIDSVRRTGSIQSPFIGVRYVMITEAIAKEQNLSSEYGALIRGDQNGAAVIPNSPASKAGIMAEDIILEVNGQKLDEGKTLAGAIQKYGVGDTITLKVRRGEQTMTIRLTLEERPK